MMNIDKNKNIIIRLENINIKNFKNVIDGNIKVNTNNPQAEYGADVIGIYGQNGSGKTSLIDSLEVLKLALCGKQIPKKYSDYINIESDNTMLSYTFTAKDKSTSDLYTIYYSFNLKQEIDDSNDNIESSISNAKEFKTVLYNETISFSYYNSTNPETKQSKTQLINTNTGNDKIFTPTTKFNTLVGKDKSIYIDMLTTKKISETTSKSFVFSKKFLTTIKNTSTNKTYLKIIEYLHNYGNNCLFIINTENSGILSFDTLPLSFKYTDTSLTASGNIMIPLKGRASIPNDIYLLVTKLIDNMNIVLNEIVPNLTIVIKELSRHTNHNGISMVDLELFSNKNSKEIPLIYESEGIRKIISILQLLIIMYNQSSITVVIDELDSGIFEYLLGELVAILSESGKGQLIFTSHNLRILETLDKSGIIFTTTDPTNRYIRFTGLKSNNNPRDFYYRDITLGERDEEVYSMTDNSDIILALLKAGDTNAT